MRNRKKTGMVFLANFDPVSGASFAPPTQQFSEPTYPASRQRQTLFKKAFGILNGIGWSATFVGGLTLTGIGTLGFGVPAVLIMTTATMPPGLLFGYFYTSDEVEAENAKEKQLIAEVAQQLKQAQQKQVEILGNILKAESLLMETMLAFMRQHGYVPTLEFKEMSISQRCKYLFEQLEVLAIQPEQQAEFRRLVLLAHAIQQTIKSLHPIHVDQVVKVVFPASIEEFNASETNALIDEMKSTVNHYEQFCEAPNCRNLLSQYKEKKSQKYLNANGECVNDLRPVASSGFFSQFKEFGKKFYSAGNNIGIGFGMGTIFCAIALASNPPGWVIIATILGIACVSLTVGVVSRYLDADFRKQQAQAIHNLSELKNEITGYQKLQLQIKSNLKMCKTKLEFATQRSCGKTASQQDGVVRSAAVRVSVATMSIVGRGNASFNPGQAVTPPPQCKI